MGGGQPRGGYFRSGDVRGSTAPADGPCFPLYFWSFPPDTLFLTQKLSSQPYLGVFVFWGLCVLFLMLYAVHMFWPSKHFPWLLLLAPSSFLIFFWARTNLLPLP